jgi:hypothetical protein
MEEASKKTDLYDEKNSLPLTQLAQRLLDLPRIRTRKDLTTDGSTEHALTDERGVGGFVPRSSATNEVHTVWRGLAQGEGGVVDVGGRVEVGQAGQRVEHGGLGSIEQVFCKERWGKSERDDDGKGLKLDVLPIVVVLFVVVERSSQKVRCKWENWEGRRARRTRRDRSPRSHQLLLPLNSLRDSQPAQQHRQSLLTFVHPLLALPPPPEPS